MRRVAVSSLTALLVSAVVACQPLMGAGDGQIGVRVKFPTPGFHIATIPTGTTSIQVTVSGDGLTTALSQTLTPQSPEWTIAVPIGAKTVAATAMDASGSPLARATSQVSVVAQAQTTATLDLQPVATPTPSPEATPPAAATEAPPPPPAPPSEPAPAPTTPTNPAPTPTPPPGVQGQITVNGGTTPAVGTVDN